MSISAYIDSVKDSIFKRKISKDEAYPILSSDDIDGVVLYFTFLNIYGDSAFDMEIETIDSIVPSEYNAARLKAMTSILPSDALYYDMFAFNAMIEAFNGLAITADTVEPYSPSEIGWAVACIMGVNGAKNFPFYGDVTKYMRASFEYEGFEMPPLFMAFPKVLDMYETDDLRSFLEVTKPLEKIGLRELADLKFDISSMRSKLPENVFNYLMANVDSAILISGKNERIRSQMGVIVLA